MSQKHRKRTDEEWIMLIRECRSSGLSDKCWCEENHIHTSSFYYQIRRLRKLDCRIPEPAHPSRSKKQEIVQVSFDGPDGYPVQELLPVNGTSQEAAIRISIPGIQVEITNLAAVETIVHTLSALNRLC